MDLSPAWLAASFLVGTIGMGFFLYGKKQMRIPQLSTGVAMMVYPYFVTSPAWMLGVGALLLASMWGAVRAGW